MRNPKAMIYGSSYDRGLEHLLKIWPDVKKEVPDAKLTVFYGWNLFDVVYGNNPERQAWKEKINKGMEQDGITHLGRISKEAIIQETEKAGIWAYPTHFGEINCITAMVSQAHGAIPVVMDYAALQETVQHGVKVEGYIWEPEDRDEYKKQLIALLNDEKRQEEIRKVMMPWAKKKFAWSGVAKQWDAEFRTPVSLEKQVESLMEDNQALKAWDLVKDTDSPLKERVWLRVKHAFDPQVYKEYYEKELIEHPTPEELALDCTKLHPRFAWVVPEILKLNPKTLIDLGCADGYLCLTLAKQGVHCTGINLYKPSVELANKRSDKHKVPAVFFADDIFSLKSPDYNRDVVVMMEVLEHLPDPQKGVDHAMSLLNDSGTAFFSTPRTDHIGVEQHKEEEGKQSWDDGKPSGHLRLFTEEEFKNLFKKYKIKQFHVDEERCMIAEVTHV